MELYWLNQNLLACTDNKMCSEKSIQYQQIEKMLTKNNRNKIPTQLCINSGKTVEICIFCNFSIKLYPTDTGKLWKLSFEAGSSLQIEDVQYVRVENKGKTREGERGKNAQFSKLGCSSAPANLC